MLQWEYIRLMNKNYIQTKIEEASINTFRYKMVLSGPIKGLLQCKERKQNGESYLIFDISSMQNLTSIYAGKKMDFCAFYQLIYAIKSTVGNMRLYLLEVENLILCPELIYQELDTGEINFVCVPQNEYCEENSIKSLYHFLLSAIDYEDSKLSEIIYETYEETEDTISLSWLENLYTRLSLLQDERLHEKEGAIKEQKEEYVEQLNGLMTEEVLYEEPSDKTIMTPKIPDLRQERCKKAAVICGIYVIGVAAVTYYIYSNYILNTYENIIITGVIVIATAIMAFWMFVWIKKKDMTAADETDNVSELSKIHTEYIESEQDRYEEQDYGKTVFLEAEQLENKLYGMGKNNRRKIEIVKFPFIIGKKQGAADELIDDASISRMHARFVMKEEKIYLEDLNSTNGTYKNGILLTPHQMIEVFPEDEIRFGRLQFIYR